MSATIRIVRMAGRDVVHTGSVAIGCAHVPPPQPLHGRDALRLQAALLEPRTATEPPLWRKVAAAVWSWL